MQMHASQLCFPCALVILMLGGSYAAGDQDSDGVPDGIDVCCATPPGITVDATGRPIADLDNDCDVDMSDFGLFQANMTGPLPPQDASPEVCDLLDNDCNGLVDDMGDISCGVGICANTVTVCVDGVLQDCEPGAPLPETCNMLDDDCDGTVDEDFDLLTDLNNCGSCDNTCPTDPTAVAGCLSGTCGFAACVGENFDINNDWVDGCEVADTVPPGHTQSTAESLGSQSCSDSATGSFTGKILSDSREHLNPPIPGFNPTAGAAPDWWKVTATGGVCTNDLDLTFSVTGGSAQACYRCTIITSQGNYTVTVTGNGSDSISVGSGAYSDNTTIYFKIEKICPLPVQEEVTYTVDFHL